MPSNWFRFSDEAKAGQNTFFWIDYATLESSNGLPVISQGPGAADVGEDRTRVDLGAVPMAASSIGETEDSTVTEAPREPPVMFQFVAKLHWLLSPPADSIDARKLSLRGLLSFHSPQNEEVL